MFEPNMKWPEAMKIIAKAYVYDSPIKLYHLRDIFVGFYNLVVGILIPILAVVNRLLFPITIPLLTIYIQLERRHKRKKLGLE
jgi:hypothetical protein